MKKLTKEQEAKIFCIKHGHATYVTKCFGYVHCGRCGTQVGDTLASCYPMDQVAVPSCPNKPCKHCDPIIKKLSKQDKIIFNRLKKGETNTEKILRGINFK